MRHGNIAALVVVVAANAACVQTGGDEPTAPQSDPANATNAPGVVTFSAANYSAQEQDPQATIVVTRQGGTSGTISVRYDTADGTAQAGSDYTARTGTLTWPAGDSSTRSFAIPILSDNTTEGAETVQLVLSEPTGGATLGANATATLTISDEPGTVRFSLPDSSIAENAGSVTLTAARVGGANGPVTVAYRTVDASAGTAPTGLTAMIPRGQAVVGSDYAPVSGTLTWTHGDTAPKTISVEIANDASTVEGDETFEVTFCESTGTTVGDPSRMTVTITEPTPTLAPDVALTNLLDNRGGDIPGNVPVAIRFTELLDSASAVVSDPAQASDAMVMDCGIDGLIALSLTLDTATQTVTLRPKNNSTWPPSACSLALGSSLRDTTGATLPARRYYYTFNGQSDTAAPVVFEGDLTNGEPISASPLPAKNASGVPSNVTIQAQIVDNMVDTSTINNNSVRLSHIANGQVRYVAGRVTIWYERGTNPGQPEYPAYVTFTPSCPLKPGTQYTAALTRAIKDTVGNPLGRTVQAPGGVDYTWTFTTAP